MKNLFIALAAILFPLFWQMSPTRKIPLMVTGIITKNSHSKSNSKFIKSSASGSSDLIYNNWKSSKTTYKSYNNIMTKKKLIQINN